MNPRDFDIGKLVPIQSNSMYLVLFLLLLGIVLVAFARIIKPNHIQGLFSTSTNMNKKILSTLSASSYLLVFNYIITLSVYIYLFIGPTLLNDNAFKLPKLPFLIILIILFHTLKIGILFLLSNWFNRKLYFDIANNLKYYQIIGLVMLPITALGFYPNQELHNFILLIGIVTLAIFGFTLRLKSFNEARQYNISYFYIILYLCTLEILPILIILKFAVD